MNTFYAKQDLIIKDRFGFKIIDVNEICYLKADGAYTIVHLIDKSNHTMVSNIKNVQALLMNMYFFRVHRSYVVNLAHIKRYSNGTKSCIEMANDKMIQIARRNKPEFYKQFKIFSNQNFEKLPLIKKTVPLVK